MSDKYLYTFDHKHNFRVEGVNMPYQLFYSADGMTPLFEVYGQDCTIYPGYSFDGCSFKKRIFGKWFGTPDGPDVWFNQEDMYWPSAETLPYGYLMACNSKRLPQLYYASGEHDCFCQYKPSGITRKQADESFLLSMDKVKWKYAISYYNAVRVWSKISGADK